MALFDRETGRLIVRVVYDGPGNAGKTTNLVEVSRAFTPRRRGELVSPEERGGRTMWFDWIQVDGGLVAGHPLRCQIVSVPGQVILRRRRMALLRSADVVVLVCDSTPAGLARVKPAFGRVRQFVAQHAAHDVPVVIQANKQDLADAIAPDEVAARLGADATTPVVGARACEGVGVRETLVLAIRAAANRVQQLVLEHGLESLAGTPDDADTVLAELRRLDSAHEHTLDELLDDAGFVEEDGQRLFPPPPPPVLDVADPDTVVVEPEELPLAPNERPTVRLALDGPPATRPKQSAIAAVPPLDAPTAPAWWPTPPTASAAVVPGNLWPASTGREALRELSGAWPMPRLELVGQSGLGDGSGKSTTVIYDAAGWCLKTSTARRFGDLDAARGALVTLARTKLALGALTIQPTLLVIGSEGADHWLWTFTPWRKTLRAQMAEAAEAGDADALVVPLVRFAHAVVDALGLALRQRIGLDLHPSNFATEDGGKLVYVDDEVTPAPPMLGAAHAILQRAEEYAKYPDAIEGYSEALVEGLERLGADDARQVGLTEGLVAATPRSLAALALRLRLLKMLGAPATVVIPPATPRPVVERAREIDEAWDAPAPLPPAPAAFGAEPEPALAAPTLEAAIVAALEPEPTPAPEPPPEPASEPEAVSASAPEAAPAPTVEVTPAPEPEVAATSEAWPQPPLAADQLPSGFIWPVVAGRELVRRLAVRTPVRRRGAGFTYELGDYTISTSPDRRFLEVDDGRAELLRLARAHVASGAPTGAEVLVLAPDPEGKEHWIWTFAPAGAEACVSP